MKKTGKVLSLVLSLALVASSLTATFASAASSETATISLTDSSIALVNGGSGDTLESPDLKTQLTDIESAVLNDNVDITSAPFALKDVAITDGSDKAKLNKGKDADDDGSIDSVTITLKNASVSGTVTLKARYETTIQRGNDDEADTNVYGTATFTVNIYDHNKAYISGDEVGTANGADPADLETMARNSTESVTGCVEKPELAGNTNALAKWTPQTVTDTVPTTAITDATDKVYKLSVSGAGATLGTIAAGDKIFTLKNNGAAKTSTAQQKLATIGKISVAAQEYTAEKGSSDAVTGYASTGHYNAKAEVVNKYLAAATGETVISKYSNKTYIDDAAVTSRDEANALDVTEITGCDVEIQANTTVQDGKIGNVTVKGTTSGSTTTYVGKLTVDGGTVGDIDAEDGAEINGGSVGDVTIASGKTLTINGGVVGDIDGSGTVEIEPEDEESPVKTGKISAKDVTVNSADKASVKTGDLSLVEGGTVTLQGDDVTVGKIDANYRAATLNLDGFKGSIAAPAHTYTEGVDGNDKALALVVSGDTDATVTGAASFNSISLNDGASLTFADKVDVGYDGASGDGTLKFAPNALYTAGNISTSIRLTKAFKAGDVIFTAATDAVDEDDFTGIGFTAEKVAASTTKDAFKVKDAEFASLEIQGSAKIPVGTTENYTAAAYPEGTKLPEGYYVQWEFSGNSDYLVATADPDDSTKISVKAVKADDTFTSLNKGTLTAYVVDADGFEDYDYPEATFDVSIGAKPVNFVSDTHGTYNMLIGQSYTFKITASDGSVPPFVVASNGATVAPYTKAGNDYFFKVTGAKVGDYGVYVGDRVCILHITDVKTDTTKVTVANGKSYVFKITKGENAPAPYFVVAGQGVVLPVDIRGNDYFYKVTNNGKTGDVGVYVNGPKIAVITFTK